MANAKDLIKNYEKAWGRVKDSESTRIQRDLCDSPTEPLCIEILGVYYEYRSAEVTKNPETEEDELLIKLVRVEDLVVGNDTFIKLPISLGDFQFFVDELEEYVDDNEKEEGLINKKKV